MPMMLSQEETEQIISFSLSLKIYKSSGLIVLTIVKLITFNILFHIIASYGKQTLLYSFSKGKSFKLLIYFIHQKCSWVLHWSKYLSQIDSALGGLSTNRVFIAAGIKALIKPWHPATCSSLSPRDGSWQKPGPLSPITIALIASSLVRTSRNAWASALHMSQLNSLQENWTRLCQAFLNTKDTFKPTFCLAMHNHCWYHYTHRR